MIVGNHFAIDFSVDGADASKNRLGMVLDSHHEGSNFGGLYL